MWEARKSGVSALPVPRYRQPLSNTGRFDDLDLLGRMILGSHTFARSHLRLPGQFADVETGLFQNGQRDYDPVSGRYIQADPIGLNAGFSRYGYVGGNPLGLDDPLGLAYQTTFSFGVAGIVPGLGGSTNAVVGVNLDGWNSTVYAQGQANAGVGVGYFVGWGASIVVSKGDSPIQGTDSTPYVEADAGWGPAVGVSATSDEEGNLTSSSVAVPYKFGGGAGLGFFVGNSWTATAVSVPAQHSPNMCYK